MLSGLSVFRPYQDSSEQLLLCLHLRASNKTGSSFVPHTRFILGY
jgi:hypothetical protein